MDLNEYQNAARKTAINQSLEHMSFGLLEEAGEVAGVLKRVWRGDLDYMPEYDSDYDMSLYARDKLMAELGDVLWYVAMLADVIDVDLENLALMNIAKLQRRKAKDMIHGAGDER